MPRSGNCTHIRVRDPEYDLQKQHQNQIWAKLSITIDKYNKHEWKNYLSS